MRRVWGKGLGLWSIRQLVAAMGGKIEVVSEPAQGSTSTVSLPRRMSEAHPLH
ncbi:MAG: hypothetical protein JST54_06960 [Deltaproteobacteria bacterium]|nr:hypothetical protein [Deltaproteobacteria bacterium]